MFVLFNFLSLFFCKHCYQYAYINFSYSRNVQQLTTFKQPSFVCQRSSATSQDKSRKSSRASPISGRNSRSPTKLLAGSRSPDKAFRSGSRGSPASRLSSGTRDAEVSKTKSVRNQQVNMHACVAQFKLRIQHVKGSMQSDSRVGSEHRQKSIQRSGTDKKCTQKNKKPKGSMPKVTSKERCMSRGGSGGGCSSRLQGKVNIRQNSGKNLARQSTSGQLHVNLQAVCDKAYLDVACRFFMKRM